MALTDEQWRFQAGCSAIEVLLFQQFTYLMMDLAKIHGAAFDNEAKSCFDRIIPARTNLRSRQLGMPQSACHLHADLVLNASYVLNTGAGFSDQSYSLWHTGQSTRWAAAAWVIISALIIELMPEKAEGIQLQDPRQTLLVKRILQGLGSSSQGTIQEIAT
jgi:hypothetical protein